MHFNDLHILYIVWGALGVIQIAPEINSKLLIGTHESREQTQILEDTLDNINIVSYRPHFQIHGSQYMVN